MTEKRFNLVDEPWIPVADYGLVSLRQVFLNPQLRAIGGTPLEKIAIMKLLLAIAQAACTPDDNAAWQALGVGGITKACLAYLDKWHEAFWLYGERPFLQMPAVAKAKRLPYGALLPHVASGNATYLFQTQLGPEMTDAQKAMLVLVNMACCFSGKKVDTSTALSPGVTKSASAEAGPALCSQGLLHSFLQGATLLQTLWYNLLTTQDVASIKTFTSGVGRPPWEAMPQGEACPLAEGLRHSLMGRLVPLARFLLLQEDGVCVVEGLRHPNYLHGSVADPSAAIQFNEKRNKALWANPSRRPWRSLASMLAFVDSNPAMTKQIYVCLHLQKGLPKLYAAQAGAFGLWCGGIKLSSHAGAQYLPGQDDVVESEFTLSTDYVGGEHSLWFSAWQRNMGRLEALGAALWGAVHNYYKAQKEDRAQDYAQNACQIFWQLAERCAEELSTACAQEAPAAAEAVMGRMVGSAATAYDTACPQDTARQLQLWARWRPRFDEKPAAVRTAEGANHGKQ